MNEKQRLITAASRQKDLVSDGSVDVGKSIAGEKKKSTAEINRFWQRKRYKDAYKKARRAGGTLTGAGGKAYESGGLFSRTLRRIRRMVGGVGNSHFLMTLAVIGVVTLLIAASISSCASFIQGIGATFTGSTYPSTDTDIYLAEAAYSALEDGLNMEIMRMEQDNPGYDEYRYQIDEIFHNPYQLISLLTTLYGEFTFPQIEQIGILQELFEAQYAITTSVSTESETVIVEEIVDPETGTITQVVEERPATIDAAMVTMEIGELVLLAIELFIARLCLQLISILITVILYSRMIEIYLYVSVSPIPFATLANREWGQVGNNYLRGLFALAFQGFFMMVCVGIYAALVSSVGVVGSNLHTALLEVMAYTVLLCFALMRTGSLSRQIFGAH